MKFKTSDIALAATLKVQGHTLLDMEVDGTKGVFVFDAVNQTTLNAFDLGDLTVEPNLFHQTIKQLTTAIRRKLLPR